MKRLLPILTVLVFLGAGCYQTADQLSSEAVAPITTSAAALKTAKETAAAIKVTQADEMAQATDPVTVAYVILDGHDVPAGVTAGETFGCNDRIGYVAADRRMESGFELDDALFSLLDFHASTVKELYNALGESRLVVEKKQTDKDGIMEVYLKGTITSGGTCDDPRIKKQVEATIAKFAPKYKIFLNGKESAWRCIGDQSGKCK